LQNLSGRLSVFDGGVVLLDNFGQVVGAQPARPEILGEDWSDRDYFRDLLVRRRFVLSNAVQDGPEGSWVVVLAAPINSANGEFQGALAGLFRLGESTVSPFYASIVRLRLGQTGHTYLVDSAGRVLYDSSTSRVGGDISERDLPPQILEGSSGALRLRDGSGRAVITAFAPIPGTGWVLVTEDDLAILMSSVQVYARTLLVLLLAAGMLPAMAVILTLRQKNREMREQERGLQEERVARLIHQSLRPRHPPLMPGWSFATLHIPCQGVGGDFHDLLTLPDGRVMAAVGTVSGGSVDSSVVMAITRTALRGSALRMIAPDEALGCSNELLCPDVKEGTQVDCVLASLDPASARLAFALAGGKATILRSSPERDGQLSPGPALGKEFQATYSALGWELVPGEAVLMISAGTLDPRLNRDGGLTPEALRQAMGARDAQGVLDVLEAQIATALGSSGDPPADVTVLCIFRSAEGS
jgi:serine phosphatase RsbU (regulator of sigma subunit)